jgi:hypothetical protein
MSTATDDDKFCVITFFIAYLPLLVCFRIAGESRRSDNLRDNSRTALRLRTFRLLSASYLDRDDSAQLSWTFVPPPQFAGIAASPTGAACVLAESFPGETLEVSIDAI